MIAPTLHFCSKTKRRKKRQDAVVSAVSGSAVNCNRTEISGFTLCRVYRSISVFYMLWQTRALKWRLLFYISATGRWRHGFWPHAGSPWRVLHWMQTKLHTVPENLWASPRLLPVALQLPRLPYCLPNHHALQLVGCSYHGCCVRKSRQSLDKISRNAMTNW